MVLVNNIKLLKIFTKEYKDITNLANSGFISNFYVKYHNLC